MCDTWFQTWGVGVVEKVLKTRARIRFPTGMRVYDRSHCRFLAFANEKAGGSK